MIKRAGMCFICFVAVLTIASGCSDTISLNSEPGTTQPKVTQYFPLDPGLSATYRIDQANGLSEYVAFSIGTSVDYQGNRAYRWIKTESNGGSDTNYFFATASGLFFLQGLSAQTEKMLSYPLTVGTSWSLYDAVTGGGDTITIGTGIDSGGNAETASGFFVEGGATLSVAAIEGIQLDHGSYYSGAVKVRNVNSNGTTNYYWYAPGIGLVKYVLGATDMLPDGQVTGELISYSR